MTDTLTLGLPADETPNPFDVPDELDGNRTPVHVEAGATLAMRISDGNDNINGIDWTADDLLTLLESRVLLTTADGAVGYAHLERGARRKLLTYRRPIGTGPR